MKKVLEVKDLTISFKTNQGFVRAVRRISFDLFEGETLAIVGESGSGKSVSTRAIMGILAGNAIIDDGQILYEGENLTTISEADFHKIRGKKIGMIFQDPLSSLNPIMKIGRQITEGMLASGKHLVNKKKDLTHKTLVKVTNLRKEIEQIKETYLTNVQNLKLESKLAKKAKKADFEKLIIKNNDKINKLKVTKNAKVAELRSQLPELVKAHKEDKKIANAQVNAEWAEAKLQSKKIVDGYKLEINENKENTDKVKELKTLIKIERENLRRVKQVTKKEAYERAIQIMSEVGIDNPEKRFKQYPFQFSGGMRQRIVIAIALTADPDILICDEPTTALDVTIQAQILELIKQIKRDRNLTVIFITHDLGVVANMADRVAVMYAGKIVEYGTVDEIFYNSRHPYTWALLSSMPDLNSKDRLSAIPGTPPDMLYPPTGDAFAYRSEFAMDIDFKEEPPFFKVSDTHYAATWLLDKRAPKVEMPSVIRDRIAAFEQSSKEEN